MEALRRLRARPGGHGVEVGADVAPPQTRSQQRPRKSIFQLSGSTARASRSRDSSDGPKATVVLVDQARLVPARRALLHRLEVAPVDRDSPVESDGAADENRLFASGGRSSWSLPSAPPRRSSPFADAEPLELLANTLHGIGHRDHEDPIGSARPKEHMSCRKRASSEFGLKPSGAAPPRCTPPPARRSGDLRYPAGAGVGSGGLPSAHGEIRARRGGARTLRSSGGGVVVARAPPPPGGARG